MNKHFEPRELSHPQGAVLACLLANPTWSPAEIAEELALPREWTETVLASDLLQAHFRALRNKQA